MSKKIYNLTYEHVKKNGSYLLFNKISDKQLAEENIVPLHIKMMESNQIPHLLPLSIEEMDFYVHLYYNTTSKRTLKSFLENKHLSSHDFYQMFIQVVSTLEQSKLYMLNEHQYVLHEDFVYLGKEVRDLYLTYVPLHSVEKEKDTMDELKDLVLKVAKKTESLQGSEMKNITNYISNPSFSLSGLKELLIELQRLRPAPGMQYSTDPYAQPNQPMTDQGMQQQHPYPTQNQANGQAQSQPSSGSQGEKKEKKQKKSATGGILRKVPPLTQRHKVYVFAGGGLALALMWKLFEMVPTSGILITSSIFTFIIAAGIVYFTFFHSKLLEKDTQASSEVAVTKESRQAQPQSHGNAVYRPSPQVHQVSAEPAQHNHQAQKLPTFQEEATPSEPVVPTQSGPPLEELQSKPVFQEAEPKPEPDYMLDTSLLSENDDTVFLGEEEEEQQEEEKPNPYLEVDRNGEIETIEIHSSHFSIGRNPSAVDYLEDSVGVSRIHIEFVKIEDQYGVKDLGSKNGTKINDATLVPYKIYSLDANDILTVGKIEYRFIWE